MSASLKAELKRFSFCVCVDQVLVRRLISRSAIVRLLRMKYLAGTRDPDVSMELPDSFLKEVSLPTINGLGGSIELLDTALLGSGKSVSGNDDSPGADRVGASFDDADLRRRHTRARPENLELWKRLHAAIHASSVL